MTGEELETAKRSLIDILPRRFTTRAQAVGVFADEDEELLTALGGQAAVAIENAVLHEEIERLFEGFVRASVVAIEARDPTTAGHSERVAELTVGLARAVEIAPPGPWRGVRFLPEDLRQLRYAALLHDFGKVGVREHVLVKAEKLHPHELELVRARFELARASLEKAPTTVPPASTTSSSTGPVAAVPSQ